MNLDHELNEIFEKNELGLFDDDEPILTSRKIASFVARRKPCKNFVRFSHLFKDIHAQLTEGRQKAFRFSSARQIQPSRFFILNGVLLYVVKQEADGDGLNTRLHCIFENGTESNMYLHSLASSLWRDKSGRYISL